MNPEDLECLLLASLAINSGILLVWFGIFSRAHDWFYRHQSQWFRISIDHFDMLNYLGLAIYKIGIILFNLVPWLALVIVY